MKLCCINTVTHKPHMEWWERISFENMLTVLRNYDIMLTVPTGMDVSEYEETITKLGKENVTIARCPSELFTFYGYNHQIMIRPWFWELFSDYEFVLTHELDAFVFRNELSEWCSNGYDFIGAPWFNRDGNTLWKVGNGGFSLIRTEKILKATKELGDADINENWEGLITSNYPHLFNLPSANEAVPFSFEINPSKLFKMNGEKLPFGCHKWISYDYESFWKGKIPNT